MRSGVAASKSNAKRRKKACYRALRFGGGGGAPRGLRRGVGAGPLDYIHSKHYFRGCSCVFRKRERTDAIAGNGGWGMIIFIQSIIFVDVLACLEKGREVSM